MLIQFNSEQADHSFSIFLETVRIHFLHRYISDVLQSEYVTAHFYPLSLSFCLISLCSFDFTLFSLILLLTLSKLDSSSLGRKVFRAFYYQALCSGTEMQFLKIALFFSSSCIIIDCTPTSCIFIQCLDLMYSFQK